MKKALYRVLAAALLSLSWHIAYGQAEVYLGVDYIDVSGPLTVPGSGGEAEVPFIVYGGTTVQALVNAITASIEQAGCSEWLTEVTIRDFRGGSEGTIVFTVEENLEEYRSVWLVSSERSVLLEQSVRGSAVYTLSSSKTSIIHGERVTFTLSGSDDFALYRLNRTAGGVMTTVSEQAGTGRSLTFTDTHTGTYTAESYYPSQVDMSGSRTVSYLSFYGYRHTSTSSGASIGRDGGRVTIAFTPHSSASATQLTNILAAYSGGQSAEWDSTMKVSYATGALTVTAGPNLGGEMDNNTWFKNSSGNEIHIVQEGGGALRVRPVRLSGTAGTQVLAVDSTQYRVRYFLTHDDEPCGTVQEGNGGTLSFSLPSGAGEYGISASYGGTVRKMQGGVVVTASGLAMEKDCNWILTSTSRNAGGTSNIHDFTSYDGLGGPEQVVQVSASPEGGNIVTPVWYDSVRRSDARVYLPYVSSNEAPVRDADPWGSQLAYYSGEYGSADAAVAYTEKEYEASPLDRVTGGWQPGSAHRTASKRSTVAYDSNAGDEVLHLRVAEGDSALVCTSYYAAGRLSKVTRTDEDGHSQVTFTDLQGRTVLERRLLTQGVWADTYYVYDRRGLLLWVVTPEGSKLLGTTTSWGVESTNAKRWCYRYRYDGKGRMESRRLPGRSVEYIVYDPAGRQVASQDGELRKSSRWLLTRYDGQGRETKRYITGPFTRYAMTSAFRSAAYPTSVYGATTNILIAETSYGTVETGDLAFSAVSGIVAASDLYGGVNRSLKTYEKLAEMSTVYSSTVKYARRSFFYDERGRLRQSVEKRSDGGVLRSSMKYDYVGNVTKSASTYTKGSFTKTLGSTLQYDSRGRLTSVSSTVDGVTSTVQYGYDGLGRRSSVTCGNGMGGTTSYNIQGWQTAQTVALGSTNVYNQTLSYYTPAKGSTPCYSGLVSEWSTKQGSATKSTYGYVYDLGGRITSSKRYSGTSTTATNKYTEKGITYDANGNVTQIKRYGSSTSSPTQYTISRSGNQVSAVNGKAYAYDTNGNTVTDGLDSLTMEYAPLNLLKRIKQGSTTKAVYSYLADGTKLKAVDGGGTGMIFAGPFVLTTADSGSTVSLESAATGSEDARITVIGGAAEATYYVRDHLGSVRTIVSSTGTVLERNDYYPFGKRHATGNSYPVLSSNLQKFNGKELQTVGSSSLRFLDYGARMYDPTTVRWLTQDPMAEKYYGYSPYNYCVGNPVLYVDEEGNEIVISAIIAAAVVSAVIDVAEQIALNAVMGEQLTSIDICSVLTSAVTGAIGAGAANVIKYMAKFGKVARFATKSFEGVIESAIEYGLYNELKHDTFSFGDFGSNIIGDLISNIFGQKARLNKRSGAEMKTLIRDTDRALRKARGTRANSSKSRKAKELISKVESYGDNVEDCVEEVNDFLHRTNSKIKEINEKNKE